MTTRIKSNRILLRDGETSGYVYFSNGFITAVTSEELPFDREIDGGDLILSPGFIDVHTHGGGGHNFSDSAEDVAEACRFHLSHGTTSICPTLASAPFAKMAKAVTYVEEVMKNNTTGCNVLGTHLEGPYFSMKQSGAQSPDHITPPVKADYEKLIEEHGSAVIRWSYAPENDEGGEFCRYLTSHGISASAGHTDAVYNDMKVAMANGLDSVTHLFSCTSTITRDHGYRILGVTETALLHDEIYAEIIADGKHLPPELIRMIVKAKGSDRVMLVTDSLPLAGTDAKEGMLVDIPFVIEDGVCRLMDRSAFAGSIATTDRLVRVVHHEAGLPLFEAVKMASAVPAEALKLKDRGEIKVGKAADLLLFDDSINIAHIWVNGEQIR